MYFLSDVDLTRVVCARPADRRHPQDPIFDTSRADRGDRGIPDRIVNDSVAKVRSKLFYTKFFDDLKRERGAKLHNLAPLYLLKKESHENRASATLSNAEHDVGNTSGREMPIINFTRTSAVQK